MTEKLWIKWQTNIAHFDRKPFQYRSLTRAMKMPNKRRESLLFGDWVDLVNSDSCNLLSKLSFWSPFVHSLDNHDLWLQYAFEWIFKDHTISQLPLLTASSTFSPIIAATTPIFVQRFHLVFHDDNQRSYHNNRKWHSILPSFQRTLYSRKKLENKSFSKASWWNCEDIYPADYVF